MQWNRWIQSVFSAGVIVGLSLALLGCGGQKKETQPPQTPAKTNQTQSSESGNPLTAPVDYVGAVGRAAQVSKKVISTVEIQSAIRQFQAMEGRNPASLQELVQKGYLARLPSVPPGYRLQYDPRTGQVRAVRVR